MPRKPILPAAVNNHIPAPVGGLNTISAMSNVPPTDALHLWNMIAGEYGLRVRFGYSEWVTGLTGAADNLVRSVLPFEASVPASSKLFVTTSSGIWDATTSTDSPTLLIAFAATTGDAGYGSSTMFVSNADGGHTLVYCDEVNGLYYYRESTATWAKIAMGGGGTDISGVDPADFVYPFVFKGRLWFVERDSGSAWYLGADALFGAANEFKFGNHFRAGGHLVGLYPWTRDGGQGMDDTLVALSAAGDILIYEVTDPSDPTGIAQKGLWYAGGLPEGRNIASKIGGDLVILTKGGSLPLSRLVTGQSTDDGQQYYTYKITNLFNKLMASTASIRGWSIHTHPEEHTLVVTYPTQSEGSTEQLTMSITGRSWSTANLPIYSAGAYQGKFYFGTIDGRVCLNSGYLDNVQLSDSNSYTEIPFAVITSFQSLGGSNQMLTMARPYWQSDGGNVAYRLEARFDFDLTRPDAPAPDAGVNVGDVWDTGEWDTAVWAGDYSAVHDLVGATGVGKHVAVAIRGKSLARTVLTGIDISSQRGGFL